MQLLQVPTDWQDQTTPDVYLDLLDRTLICPTFAALNIARMNKVGGRIVKMVARAACQDILWRRAFDPSAWEAPKWFVLAAENEVGDVQDNRQ